MLPSLDITFIIDKFMSDLFLQNKVYPRELDHRDPKVRGRIRVQLRDENGGFLMPEYKTSKEIYIALHNYIYLYTIIKAEHDS